MGLNRSKSLQIKIKVYETRKPGKCYTKLDVQNKFPKLKKKKNWSKSSNKDNGIEVINYNW